MTAITLKDLPTPCLALDEDRVERNINCFHQRLDGLGVALHPHVKTAKSVEVARPVMSSPAGPATVSPPNHACATAVQHGHYHVVRGCSSKVEAQWPRLVAGNSGGGQA